MEYPLRPVAADDARVRALIAIVDDLPAPRRDELLRSLVRAAVGYESDKDPEALVEFVEALLVSLRLHSADPGYAHALARAAESAGRPESARLVTSGELAERLAR